VWRRGAAREKVLRELAATIKHAYPAFTKQP
jgi:hypothetical protein